ncbi:MAG: metal-dependent transcriptional regulator [Faecalibacterium sp.]
MELTSAHLRYLLAIYEVSQTHLDISSRSIAEKLGVTKPSVVRIMNLLMERGMIVKEHYGKIYMTDRGIWVAKQVDRELKTILTHFPPVGEPLSEEVGEPLSEEERFTAALAMTSALPERIFTGEYERLFGSDAEKAETEKAQ